MSVLNIKTFVFILLFLPLSLLFSESKTLEWEKITVDAFIDKEGTLDVTEIQAIRFNGEWNGAYRRFDLGWGNKFTFKSLERKTEDGNWVLLSEGNLTEVDTYEYDLVLREVKWRSRMPNDPPFNEKLIEYRLKFKYQYVLSSEEDKVYRLKHDFCFTDREWMISKFIVNLKLDEHWKVKGRSEKDFFYESHGALSPGYTMQIEEVLEFLGNNTANISVSKLKIYSIRILWIIGIICLLAIINILIYQNAKKVGVMDDPVRIETWEEFNLLFEGLSPEYISILAESSITETWMTRLLFEKKIQLLHLKDGKFIFKKLVPTDSFALIDQKILKDLFINGKEEISTDEIKDHYRGKKTSYSLAEDLKFAYTREMERIGLLDDDNSLLHRMGRFIFNELLFNMYSFFLFLIVSGLAYFYFLDVAFGPSGISPARFIISLIAMFVSISVVSLVEDVHYGFGNLERDRHRYFVTRFLRSIIPGIVLISFYIWSLQTIDALYFILIFCMFVLGIQHLLRFLPQNHIRQIRSTLKALALKNFLHRKLLSSEKCDIPANFSPYIAAFDLSFSLKYRQENLNLDDIGYLLPENFSGSVGVDTSSTSGFTSGIGSNSISTSSNMSSVSFSGSGGTFGGAGASASWSDMSSFSSSSSYSPPSSSSSSSSSSSGGGGGGGW